MATAISCVDRDQLQRLLALDPSADERQALDAHLGQCDQCRRLLLELTSEAVRMTLTAAPLPESRTTDLSGSRTQDRHADAPTLTRVKESDFLEPPRESGHLGRLAHYELLEVIGRGGMGTVFKAHDETLHRIVAVKLMSPELAAGETSRQRFIREARAAAQVNHEHVVTIHAVDDKGRIPFLVMQHVEGKSLQQRLQDGPLTVPEIVRIGLEMAKGLGAAHGRGLVHRDIKPGNVLLEAPSGRVKITDFGLARAVDDASLSQSGAVIGTPLYMAPEQARGAALDHRADLFSLGAVLYAMCTGFSPFRAPTSLGAMRRVCDDDPDPIRTLNPEVPAWLEQVIRKLLAKDPAARFQSAAELVAVLGRRHAALEAGKPIVDDSRTEPLPVIRPRSRSPMLIGVTASTLVFAIAAVIYFATRDRHQDNPDQEREVAGNKQPPNQNPIANPNGLVPFPGMPGFEQIWQGGGLLPDPDQMRKLWEMHPFVRDPELIHKMFQGFGPFGRDVHQDSKPVGWMANSSDGKYIAVPVGGNVALMGDKADNLPSLEMVDSQLHCVAFSPDDRWLIGGCEAKSANLVRWDLQSGKIAMRYDGHRGEVNSINFGPASRFVTASNDGTAKVWTITSREASTTFGDHQDFVRCAVFFPGQMRVASGGDDKTVRIWDANSGKQIRELAGHSAPVRTIVFSPNGRVMVSGSDNEMKLWDAESLNEFTTIRSPAGWLAFAPDGLTLFSAACDHKQGTDHAVTLWNTRNWEQRTTYALKSRGGQAVYHLSADGGILLGSRPALASGTPVGIYHALSGKDLSVK